MSKKTTSKQPLTYRDAGVDIEAGNALVEQIKPLVKKTLRPEVLTGLGGFGGLFQLDSQRYQEPVLVSGTDGVGTKLVLARHLDNHQTIGIDLVAMCVNDVLTQGAEPMFFLDYFACGKLALETAKQVISGIAEGCLQAGCALIGGETAEMPGMYEAGEYDLAGFTVGVVEKSGLIDGQSIETGHQLIGLASSGPHSNGYSLIRKVVERSGADLNTGFDDRTLGQALLAPTRIYVKPVLAVLQQCRVAGIAHITGGGLTENIVRILPPGLAINIDLQSWQRPAIFDWLQQNGGIEEPEMLRTFNCGTGLVLVLAPDESQAVLQTLASLGETAYPMGEVVQAEGDSLVRFINNS